LLAKELINDEIMPLKTSDKGKDALSWMEEYKVSHLPIVNNEELLGLISESDIYDFNSFDEPIGSHPLSLQNPYVYEWQHIFEVIKLIEQNKLSLIPVVDSNNKYLGIILLQDIIYKLSKMMMLDNPGALLILEMSIKDYSLTEIANIVESNNAKVLTLSILNQPESTRIEVILKLNTTEIKGVLQTFERYNYTVNAIYDEQTDSEGLKERYDMLMKYLNL
jgi:Mg/Co/Ni transporter MgtE